MRTKQMSTPQITILMSVYNGLPYLREAVDSMLTQTCKDFEFIIIDDCSDDGSTEIIEEYVASDDRIVFIKNKQRLELGANLRYGVSIAKGTWIARMDADDISVSNRLEKQLQYVTSNPQIDIVGSYAIDIDKNGVEGDIRRCPTSHEDIVKYVWTCPVIHPTVFIKKSALLSVGSYGLEKRRQDYALWFRCAAQGLRFANLPEPLLKYRFTPSYFHRNNFIALLTQVKIGWNGCLLVRASPIAYLGVTVPLIKGMLPKRLGMFISSILKKFDPRYK